MKRMIDEIDARILDVIQQCVPFVDEPFKEISRGLGMDESNVISRVAGLKERGIVRQIGAILEASALGYASALVACRVDAPNLEKAAEAVARHEGVSHCYSRDSDYNLWFTITVGPENDIYDETDALLTGAAIEEFHVLPALKVYKIGVMLRMGDEVQNKKPVNPRNPRRRALSPEETAVISALQNDMEIAKRPFDGPAAEAGLTVDNFLRIADDLLNSGVIRRYAAVLRHREAGFTANAMVCWAVDENKIDNAGEILSGFEPVSHCYHRPGFEGWPYNLYTMVHAVSQQELERVIREMASALGIESYRILRTVNEFKKTRVRYLK